MKAVLRRMVFMVLLPLTMICLNRPSEGADSPVWSNLGIYGGQVATVAIHPSNPDKLFAGTYFGDGLYVSENGGGSWRPVEKETFQNTVVFDLAIAPSDPRTIWAVHDYWVERSKDGGRSWTHFKNSSIQRDCSTCGGEGDDFRFCQTVAVDPVDPETAYVGTGGPSGAYDHGAVYGTSDGGESWTKLQEFDYAVVDMAIDPVNSDVIWIVTSSFGYGAWDGTLYRSVNGGEIWETIFSLAPFQTAFQSIAVVPGTSDTVFTGCGRGLIKHWFDGETWQITFPVIEGSTLIRDIVFAPSDPNVVYIPWVDYFSLAPMLSISKDGGLTWETQPLAEDRFNGILAVAVHPGKANVLYSGDEALGLLKSDDFGTTWTPNNNGISATIVYDVDVDPSDRTHLIAGTIAGVYQRRDGGAWRRILSVGARSVRFHPDGGDTFYAGTGFSPYLYQTVDGGDTWSRSDRLDFRETAADETPEYHSTRAVAIDPADPNTLFIAVHYFRGPGKLLKSSDGGATFRPVLDAVNSEGVPCDFNTVAVDPNDSNHVFAGGGNFYAPRVTGGLWESRDGGLSWSLAGLTDVIVNDLLIEPGNTDILYAGCGYSGGTDAPLYKSEDGGATWAPISNGLDLEHTGNAVTELAFHRENKDVMYAGTFETGVYLSVNRGKDWLLLGTPDYAVFSISAGSLYAATQGGLLQCTGTGVIAGTVTDASRGKRVDASTLFTDFGVTSRTVDGEYMMVSPAGTCDVTAIADGYGRRTRTDVSVYGGDVTWVDLEMDNGSVDPAGDGEGVRMLPQDGGDYCFIGGAGGGPRNHLWSMLLPGLLLVLLFLVHFSGRGRSKRFGVFLSAIFLILPSALLFINQKSDAATLFQQVGVASSPNPVGSGARAVGMGGAFIGIADDATAASWNPAGLIQLEKPEISMVLAWNARRESYGSGSHPEADNTGDVDASSINYFSAAYPFQLGRNMIVSINYQRLYEFQRELDYRLNLSRTGLDLLQRKRYTQDGFIGALGLAGAVEITPRVSLGVTMNIWTDEFLWNNGWRETYSEHGEGTLSGVPVTTDVQVHDDYSHFRGINFNLGLMWNRNSDLTLGAVLKTPFTASLSHKFRFHQIQRFELPEPETITSGQHIIEDVELDMPLSYGLGVAWRLSDTLSLDLDIYRTHWNDYLLEDSRGNSFSPIDGQPEGDSDIEDTIQVRVGGEYLIIRPDRTVIPLRAGLFYDPEPSSGSPKDFFGLSLGTGITYKGFVFDVAYQYRWGGDVDTGNLIRGTEADISQHTLLASAIVHF